jgi:hypothetical protein
MTASGDSIRDAYALVQCSLNDDQEGARVIKDAADLGEVAGVLADTVAELFRSVSRVLVPDGDPMTLLARVREALAGEGDLRRPATKRRTSASQYPSVVLFDTWVTWGEPGTRRCTSRWAPGRTSRPASPSNPPSVARRTCAR